MEDKTDFKRFSKGRWVIIMVQFSCSSQDCPSASKMISAYWSPEDWSPWIQRSSSAGVKLCVHVPTKCCLPRQISLKIKRWSGDTLTPLFLLQSQLDHQKLMEFFEFLSRKFRIVSKNTRSCTASITRGHHDIETHNRKDIRVLAKIVANPH